MALSGVRVDTSLLDYATYEDYLDTHISINDYRYLANKQTCYEKILLNYSLGKEVYTREQFEANRELTREQVHSMKKLSHDSFKFTLGDDPVLQQLAARERPNYQKIISTIIFLSYRDNNGFEKSGFIDFEASLQRSKYKGEGATDWNMVYKGKIKLLPKPHDLSYYDIHNGIIRYNSSENYSVQHDVRDGLTFLHRGDHKKIYVGKTRSGIHSNCHRSIHFSNVYGYVIFYDHIVRKKI